MIPFTNITEIYQLLITFKNSSNEHNHGYREVLFSGIIKQHYKFTGKYRNKCFLGLFKTLPNRKLETIKAIKILNRKKLTKTEQLVLLLINRYL